MAKQREPDMTGIAEVAVLGFLKRMNFPGIRLGERNPNVCDFLKRSGYHFTPDLVSGPDEIDQAPVEGLFFIDIIQPTSDLLFKSSASHGLSINVSRTFKKILDDAANDKENPSINRLPIEHHQCYLEVLNKKLDKYSHKRPFTRAGSLVTSANLGIVHHFNLGTVAGTNVANVRGLITLLDYLRFYKSLAASPTNIDLRIAENRLLMELLNQEQRFPYVMMVFRKWHDVPHLFLMIHVTVKKSNSDMDIAIILLNSALLDAVSTHPVHRWFACNIQNNSPESLTNEESTSHKATISFDRNGNLFS